MSNEKGCEMTEDQCPKCASKNIYFDQTQWVCPECAHEWVRSEITTADLGDPIADRSVRDANGAILNDGDSVIVIKELKIKGASRSVKGGTKVRNIKLVDDFDGHNIACRIDGIGQINLKSEFVRKA